MYYYQQKGDYLFKYELSYDREELLKIRNNILKECTNVIHHTYIVDEANYLKEVERAKTEKGLNYQNFISVKNLNGTYKLEYDEYPKIKIIDIIDELLEGNTSILQDLVNPSEPQPLKYNSKEISQNLSDVLDSLFFNPTLNQIIVARNMKDNYDNAIKYERRAEEQQRLLQKYSVQISNLLCLKECGYLSISDLKEVLTFIADIDESNLDTKTADEILVKLIK